MNKTLTNFSLLVALSFVACGTAAQETRMIEEVVVTAQKRAQSLQEVPIAVDAFTSDAIEKSGVDSLTELSQISSSFNIDEGTGGGQPYIRGIGSAAGGSGVNSAVAVYVDGAYISRNYSLTGIIADLDGVESIQVLKGPQGSLYGRNATGGAVIITTETPEIGDELNGRVKATIGDYGVQEFSARISGGLGDHFAGSLGYSDKEGDGFTKNLSGVRDLDDTDDYQISAKLVFEPIDSARFVLAVSENDSERQHINFNQVGQGRNIEAEAIFPGAGLNNPQALYAAAALPGLAAFGLDLTNPAVLGAVFAGAAGLEFSNDYGKTYINEVGGVDNGVLSARRLRGFDNGGYAEDLFVSMTATIEFDTFNLVSVTAYNDHGLGIQSEVLLADASSAPDFTTSLAPFLPDPSLAPALSIFSNPNVGFSGVFESDYISEELYLVSTDSRIEWLAGIYYFKEDGNTTFSNDGFGQSASGSNNDWGSEASAIFAEATIPVGDQWSVTLGARYSDEDNYINDFVAAPIGVGNVERGDDQVTYNAKIAYQGDDWLAYAGFSTGFKSGSLNPQSPSAVGAEPEEITAFEVGLKSQLMDDRIQLNASAFYYDYENIQLFVLDAAASTQLYDGADPEILGLELDVQAVVSDNLDVYSSFTLLDHEYTADAVLPGTTSVIPLEGNSLVQTADFVAVVGAEYALPLRGGSELRFNLNANYNSGYWVDNLNIIGSGGLNDDDYTVANASMKFSSADEKWSVALYVNNLTDEEYFNGGASANSLALVLNSARPRHYGVTGTYSF